MQLPAAAPDAASARELTREAVLGRFLRAHRERVAPEQVGLAPGRRDAGEITLFDSVGFALEDYSAMRHMQALAREHGLLQRLRLIPELADPKDLYGLVRGAGAITQDLQVPQALAPAARQRQA